MIFHVVFKNLSVETKCWELGTSVFVPIREFFLWVGG